MIFIIEFKEDILFFILKVSIIPHVKIGFFKNLFVKKNHFLFQKDFQLKFHLLLNPKKYLKLKKYFLFPFDFFLTFIKNGWKFFENFIFPTYLLYLYF
jgi:hypothetical protein